MNGKTILVSAVALLLFLSIALLILSGMGLISFGPCPCLWFTPTP